MVDMVFVLLSSRVKAQISLSIHCLWRKKKEKLAQLKAFSYVTSPLTGGLGRKKRFGKTWFPSHSASLQLLVPHIQPVVISLDSQKLLSTGCVNPRLCRTCYYCTYIRESEFYPATQATSWTTGVAGYFSSVTEESCF